jgi:hypothetical protein
MKQGVCHPELPIASAGRTQRRIGFIFQIVDLWRARSLSSSAKDSKREDMTGQGARRR